FEPRRGGFIPLRADQDGDVDVEGTGQPFQGVQLGPGARAGLQAVAGHVVDVGGQGQPPRRAEAGRLAQLPQALVQGAGVRVLGRPADQLGGRDAEGAGQALERTQPDARLAPVVFEAPDGGAADPDGEGEVDGGGEAGCLTQPAQAGAERLDGE